MIFKGDTDTRANYQNLPDALSVSFNYYLLRKKVDKLDRKILLAFRERLELFTEDPYHPLLDNHKLSGDRKHQRSINITGDWRLVFEHYDENTVRLIDVDTHSNLYGK